jgi:hypothetical protein
MQGRIKTEIKQEHHDHIHWDKKYQKGWCSWIRDHKKNTRNKIVNQCINHSIIQSSFIIHLLSIFFQKKEGRSDSNNKERWKKKSDSDKRKREREEKRKSDSDERETVIKETAIIVSLIIFSNFFIYH